MKKLIPLLLCMALILPGCANIQNDSTRTTTEGALVGGVAGAGIGAIIGKLTGSTALGAAIGGVVGAVGGAMVGKHIANKKSEYASREEWLDACILDAQNKNNQITADNAKMKAEIAELEKKSSQLAVAYKNKQVSANSVKSTQRDISKQQEKLSEYIKGIEDEIKIQNTVIADAREGQNNREADIIEHEIKKMEQKIAEMKEESSKLANMSMLISI